MRQYEDVGYPEFQPLPFHIPFTVDHGGSFVGIKRDEYPVLQAMVAKDIKVGLRSLMRLFVNEVRLPRVIGFMAKHSIRGENWKAWI